jgi:ferric-dicitrate binding protein FerR (iron transport regulator)
MNACKQTQALLFEKADGRLEPAAHAGVEAHLAVCAHCKQVFAAWTSALPQLRAPAPDDLSAISLRRMENEVMGNLPGAAAPRSRQSLWVALAAGLVLVTAGALVSIRALTPPPFARIQTMWGRVTLSGVAMTTGAAMEPGGVLEIAAEGEAAFQVGRAAEVRLDGPGRVAFDGATRSPRLRLDSGRLTVQIGHRRSDESFAVATAHGRIEVRGTRFVIGYAGPGSYVHVDEGEVAAFRAGAAPSFPVKSGDTFWFSPGAAPVPPSEPATPPRPATNEPRVCPMALCREAGARARRAMRAGSPVRACDMVDQALAELADCSPAQSCLDELGYLRAEALRQAGRLEAAVTAFRALNRPSATRAMRQNALYASAQLERRLGHAGDARQNFDRAYAACPDGALAEEALAALLDLDTPNRALARTTAERYLAHFPRGVAAARARRILSTAPGAP